MVKGSQLFLTAALFFVAGYVVAFLLNSTYSESAFYKNSGSETFEYRIQKVNDIKLPDSFELCGEPVPIEERSVMEMLDREFNITVWDRAQVILYLKRAGRYFPFIEKKLAMAGMPDDLKYLAVAESALITRSLSYKGARGPWQFMTPTAKSHGLRRDRLVDERLNFEHSTVAALKELKRLNRRFNSWTLAMAAYNCGETRVAREIKEQNTDNYYRLSLPLETERYIFRIAAIKIVMEKPETYGYELSPESIYRPLIYDVVETKIKIPLDIVDIAESLGISFKNFIDLNPQFLSDQIPVGEHLIQVPSGYGFRMVNILKQVPGKVPVAVQKVTTRRPVTKH